MEIIEGFGQFIACDNNAKVIGQLDYTMPDEEHVEVLSTEVDEAFQGQGIGSALVAEMIKKANKANLKIIPHCEFAKFKMKQGIEA